MTAVVLIGVLAAAVAVAPNNWFTSTHLQDAIDRVVFADHMLRARAVRHGGERALVIDLNDNTVAIMAEENSDRRSHRFAMPRGYEIKRVITATGRFTSGVATIRCSDDGHTLSYALFVSDLDGQEKWLFVAGLTGQSVVMDHENDVKGLFQLLAP